MPIYIQEGNDHRQISADDLAKIMGISKEVLQKIRKNPVFEVNPKLTKPDKINGGITAPAGKGNKPIIYVKVKKAPDSPYGVIVKNDNEAMTATTLKLRYCISIIPDRENHNIFTYEPKRLNFYDRLEVINNNIEQSLFFFCLPSCVNSPVADKRNWYYQFQDKENKADLDIDKATKISRAFALINNKESEGGLSEASLLLVAKGLYTLNEGTKLIPNPSARNKTIKEVKADLINLAYKDPDLFLNSTDDDVNKFYGMVMDAVDRQIFEIRTSGKQKAWYWADGPDKGQKICEITGMESDFNHLKGAIEANPNAFYANITRAVSQAQGRDNVANFMRNQKDEDFVPDDIGDSLGDEPVFRLPTALDKSGYADACNMFISFNSGKRPSPKALGAFWKLIKENKVTAENIKETVAQVVAEDI